MFVGEVENDAAISEQIHAHEAERFRPGAKGAKDFRIVDQENLVAPARAADFEAGDFHRFRLRSVIKNIVKVGGGGGASISIGIDADA